MEQQSLDVVAKWIKEVNNTEAYEDILREVIVIPDDDEDDSGDAIAQDRRQTKANEREINNPPRTLGRGEIWTRPLDHSALQDPQNRYESPDALERSQPQILGHGQYIMQPHQQDLLKSQRVGMRRQQLWEQALDRRIREPETYRAIREAPHNHLPLALRTIEAQHPSSVSSQDLQKQGYYLQQMHPASVLQETPRPHPTLRVHTQVPQVQHGALPQARDTQVSHIQLIAFHDSFVVLLTSRLFIQTYRQDPPIFTHSLPMEPHTTSAASITSHQHQGSPRQALPYQTSDQRLVSSHQPLYEPSKQDHSYLQSGYVEKLVPSIEGRSQGSGQPENTTTMQRPLQNLTSPNHTQANALPHRPVVHKVVSYAEDSANLAKRRRTDDVDLQNHSFWQADQRQQERIALVPMSDRDRQVKYINYSDIRQQVGETRLVPVKESVSSHRQSVDSREQGNPAKFSLNHQERVMIRPVQPHEAHGQASHISASFAPLSTYSPNSALQVSQIVPHERVTVLQRSDRPVEYVQHGLQRSDPARGRPPEGNSLKQWEDPHREVIVIDSPPEPQRSERAIPFHDGASLSTRPMPDRAPQAHGTHYGTRPASYVQLPKGVESRDRIVLQNGETLHRYHVVPEPAYRAKQNEKPVQQVENHAIPFRHDPIQGYDKSRYLAPQQQQQQQQQQQHYGSNADRDRHWYDIGFGISSVFFVLH